LSSADKRATVERLRRAQVRTQGRIADETAKIARLRAEAARLRLDAARLTSPSMRASKLRSAESREHAMVTAERRLLDAMAQRSREDTKLGRALDDLRRAEATDEQTRERESKRRRDAETAHVKGIARAAKRPVALSSPGVHPAADPGWEVGGSSAPAPRRVGRPKGPSFIRTHEDIKEAYLAEWREAHRRPYWTAVARRLGVDARTLLNARRALGVDEQAFRLDE